MAINTTIIISGVSPTKYGQIFTITSLTTAATGVNPNVGVGAVKNTLINTGS